MKKKAVVLILVLTLAVSSAAMLCSAAAGPEGTRDGGQALAAGKAAAAPETDLAEEAEDCSSRSQEHYGRETWQNEAIEVIEENISAENFGGLYLDEDGVLTVNVTDLNEAEKTRAALGRNGEKVAFSKVKYSLAYLESAVDLLVPYMNTYGILTLDADDRTNQLVISLSDGSGENLNGLLATVDALSIPSDCVKINVEPGVSVRCTVKKAER